MKTLHSLPNDKGFFDNYATLIKSVVLAGIFAQVISGLTESGSIFTNIKQSLAPFHLDWWGIIIAGLAALLATAVIEVGLRKTFPVAVDAVLYKRWSGLDLPISIFVWLLAVVLMLTSGLLSFHNSKVIVDDFTPEAEQLTTTVADSTYQANTAIQTEAYQVDSAMIASTYASRATATATAYDGKIRAKDEQLRGYESKEVRTGRSYASRKDRTRQDRANLEAEKAATLADLEAAKAGELTNLKTAYRTSLADASKERTTATNEVKETNNKAEADRLATVNGYGGGLGWFTVVCLFLFAVSVILERIYKKGAGIDESVQIEAYDFRPSAFVEWFAAIRERVNYKLHSKITAYANKTPAAPLPAQPSSVYDLAEALQHVTIKLELDNTSQEEERVIYLNAKEPDEQEPGERRQIGFQQKNSTGQAPNTNTNSSVHTHENSCAVKDTQEVVSLADATQRLKMYKKRLGGHQQKAIKQENKNGKICKRTADAIANNREWVSHYEQVISELKNQGL